MKSVQVRIQDVDLVTSSSPTSPTLQKRKNRSVNIQPMILSFSLCLMAWNMLRLFFCSLAGLRPNSRFCSRVAVFSPFLAIFLLGCSAQFANAQVRFALNFQQGSGFFDSTDWTEESDGQYSTFGDALRGELDSYLNDVIAAAFDYSSPRVITLDIKGDLDMANVFAYGQASNYRFKEIDTNQVVMVSDVWEILVNNVDPDPSSVEGAINYNMDLELYSGNRHAMLRNIAGGLTRHEVNHVLGMTARTPRHTSTIDPRGGEISSLRFYDHQIRDQFGNKIVSGYRSSDGSVNPTIANYSVTNDWSNDMSGLYFQGIADDGTLIELAINSTDRTIDFSHLASSYNGPLREENWVPSIDGQFNSWDAVIELDRAFYRGMGYSVVSTSVDQNINYVLQHTFNGDSVDDFFGWSVSGAGDVNGDGFADLIVGAYKSDNNGTDSGSARVLSGIDGSVLYDFDGDSSSDLFGFSVSGAGDVNGDGFADLIVGAHGDNSNRGSAQVFSGIDGSILYTFDGDSALDQLGRSVSGAGDVNGDGFADLIVGAPLDDNNGSRSGSARVFSGVDGSVLYNFDGDSADDWFGRSVSGAGDVNGDGFDDFVVGAPFDDDNGQDSGRARVFSGIDGSVLYNLDGNSTGDSLGGSVSGAGDVNGDGFDDLIVDSGGGTVRVFSGVDSSVLYNFAGTTYSRAGDVNGDGFADLFVGASGTVQVFSGIDGSVLYTIDADSVSTSLSSVGDANGDGVDDVVVGVLGGGANNGGYARLFVSQISATILGDCNLDGVVNFLDITPFVRILSSGSFLEEADINQDGAVNFLDITPFLEILAGN